MPPHNRLNENDYLIINNIDWCWLLEDIFKDYYSLFTELLYPFSAFGIRGIALLLFHWVVSFNSNQRQLNAVEKHNLR